MTVNEILKRTEAIDKRTPRDIQHLTYMEFMQLSEEERKDYIEALRSVFCATDEMIASVLGVSKSCVTKTSNALCCAPRLKGTTPQKAALEAWMNQDQESEDLTGKEEEAGTTGSLELTATLGDVAAMLQAMAIRDGKRYAVRVEWRAAT